jgi:hypothetical protein
MKIFFNDLQNVLLTALALLWSISQSRQQLSQVYVPQSLLMRSKPWTQTTSHFHAVFRDWQPALDKIFANGYNSADLDFGHKKNGARGGDKRQREGTTSASTKAASQEGNGVSTARQGSGSISALIAYFFKVR